jgi:hypothetical protein
MILSSRDCPAGFLGTTAQVDLGTFVAQKKFFSSFWIYAAAPGGWRVPVFPGGLAVGFLWGGSLIAALICRFSFTRRNAGLLLSHCGLILLLAGQFLTHDLSPEKWAS